MALTHWMKEDWGLMRQSEFLLLIQSLETTIKKNLEARVYVELGVYRAKTSPQIMKRLDARHAFVGVDVWSRSGSLWGQRVERKSGSGDDQPETTFFSMTTIKAAQIFDLPCAWVFVDACHCFDCVFNDILLWGSKVVVGGYVVFHDTEMIEGSGQSPHGESHSYGVRRAVDESTFLADNFQLRWEIKDGHGLRVYERI